MIRWEFTGSQPLLLWNCGEKGTSLLRGHLWVADISCTQPLGRLQLPSRNKLIAGGDRAQEQDFKYI